MPIHYSDNTASRTPIAASGLADSALIDIYSGSERSLTLAELKKTGLNVVNVKQYGAVGDGVADDTAEIAAAILSISGVGGTIFFPPGTYKVSGDFTLTSNTNLYGPNATLTRSTGTTSINIKGTSSTSSNIYETGLKNYNTIKVSTKSIFNVDDWLCLVNSPNAEEDSSKGKVQELFKVIAVDTSSPSFDILTLHCPLSFDYMVAGMATPSIAYLVSLIENISIEFKSTYAIQFAIELAKNISIKVADNQAVPLISQTTAPGACENGRFIFNSLFDIAPVSGPNSHSLFYGWRNLYVDATCVGGTEDGVRIRSSSLIDARINVASYGARAINVYKVRGKLTGSVKTGPLVAVGNVENVLIDFCEDLYIDNIIVTDFLDGDGIELRGGSKNITINNPYIIARNNSAVAMAMSLHPSDGHMSHIKILGGLIIGDIRGINAADQCNDLIIDGVKFLPTPSSSIFIPISINDSSYGQFTDVKITNNYIVPKNSPAISLNGASSLGSPVSNCILDNNMIGPPGTSTSYITATEVVGLNITNTSFVGKNQTQVVNLVSPYATGGTFTLSYLGESTSALPYNISATGLQSAINLLDTIKPDSVVHPNGDPVTVALGTSGIYTLTFSDWYDRDPQLFTADITNISGVTKHILINPTTYETKRLYLSNCSNVKLNDNERPSTTTSYNILNSDVKNSSDISILDDFPTFLMNKKPKILDTFTNSDGTVIASHVGEIGNITWLESSGTFATILSNRLRMGTSNSAGVGNMAYTDVNTNIWSVDIAYFAADAAGLEYSLVFDYVDPNNHAAVMISRAASYGDNKAFKLVENISGVQTVLDSYPIYPWQGNTHSITVNSVGKYITASLGQNEILSGTLTQLRGSGIIGIRKDAGNLTSASVVSAITITY